MHPMTSKRVSFVDEQTRGNKRCAFGFVMHGLVWGFSCQGGIWGIIPLTPFIGGKAHGAGRGRGYDNKTAVLGIKQRGGRKHAEVIPT
jgi:hypothetical protein